MSGESFVKKHGYVIQLSREMALQYGVVEPTPEERAERDARHAAHLEEKAAAQAELPAALAALDAIQDTWARRILDLHGRDADTYRVGWVCSGCDMDGYEAERPEWPCRTTATIAEGFDITIPDPMLFERPTDGSLDTRRDA